jgi:Mlc titration factor MtfA (ptsG expression regulator)
VVLPLLILFVATAALIVWLLREPLFVEWRRRRLRQRPFPAEWRQHLRRGVPYLQSMPVDLQLQLKQHIQVFLAEKPFIGCAGLEVTDAMRVTIAAQACLLLLNRRTGYFPELRQVLVYPGAFVVDKEHVDESGVVQDVREVLAGESWSQGQVILSWEDVVDGAAVPDDGRNVVIHEFAHQLDQENGPANGAPRLPNRAAHERWARVLGAEFAVHQRHVRKGWPTLIDGYGATDPAEFFAVASEVFFEQPRRLADEHAALYGELRAFYKVDPLSW